MVFLRKTLYILFVLLMANFQWLMAKKPAGPTVLPTEQEQQFSYYWYAAKQAITQERYADAYALLEFCRMLKPNDGQTLTFLGIIYDGIGQKERAEEAFRLAYEADPEGQWQRWLDRLLQQQIKETKWKDALKTQDEIDRHQGYDGSSAYNRFRIYASWGKYRKAIEAIDKYLETDPTNMQFLLLRMEFMERIGAKPTELYETYERVLAVDPMHLGVLNNYAYFLATHHGDLQKAERMSAITIREEPTNPIYLDTYGWIMHMQGQDELAVFYLKRALSNVKEETNKNEIEKHLNSIK